MAERVDYLEALIRETRKSEDEVRKMALRTGLRQLWRERMLGRFLKGEITRQEAVDALGLDWVELAERQNQAMLEDLEWALSQPKPQ